MKKTIIFVLITFFGSLALILGLGSCKFPPTEEMNRAFDAVMRADNDYDAVTYAPNTLARAREALGRMQMEADLKRFDEARSLAAEAVNLAERAIAEGKTGAVRARDEAANLLAIVGRELTETEAELEAAKNAGGLELDVASLEQDLAAAKGGYGDANECLTEEEYLDAIAKADSIRPVLADIRACINDAAMLATGKKN